MSQGEGPQPTGLLEVKTSQQCDILGSVLNMSPGFTFALRFYPIDYELPCPYHPTLVTPYPTLYFHFFSTYEVAVETSRSPSRPRFPQKAWEIRDARVLHLTALTLACDPCEGAEGSGTWS